MLTLRKILDNSTFRIITDSEDRFEKIRDKILGMGISPRLIEISRAIMIPENPSLGCNTSQIKAMENFPSEGYLCILEDDVEIHPDFDISLLDEEIGDIPSVFDSLYLGSSKWGFIGTKAKFDSIIYEQSEMNPDFFVRVMNMFSTHAILHLNPKYTKKIRESVMEKSYPVYIEPNDISNAMSQRNFKCMALRIPMFYQAGVHEYCTKFKF